MFNLRLKHYTDFEFQLGGGLIVIKNWMIYGRKKFIASKISVSTFHAFFCLNPGCRNMRDCKFKIGDIFPKRGGDDYAYL